MISMPMKRQDRDAFVGAAILMAGALLFGLVYGREMRRADTSGYLLTAHFHQADGIGVGSAVRLSGVAVGQVVAASLGPDFRAALTLRIDNGIQLPDDTGAAIQTDGLMGAKYIDLRVGADDAVLAPGAEITYTQDSIVLDDLLNMVIDQARAKRGYLGKPLPGLGD